VTTARTLRCACAPPSLPTLAALQPNSAAIIFQILAFQPRRHALIFHRSPLNLPPLAPHPTSSPRPKPPTPPPHALLFPEITRRIMCPMQHKNQLLHAPRQTPPSLQCSIPPRSSSREVMAIKLSVSEPLRSLNPSHLHSCRPLLCGPRKLQPPPPHSSPLSWNIYVARSPSVNRLLLLPPPSTPTCWSANFGKFPLLLSAV
jgi:hypothetical protein